jgi:uncharacterized protein (UPF0147 family)
MADIVQTMKDLADDTIIPKDVRKLRACIHCHMVKHISQFEK